MLTEFKLGARGAELEQLLRHAGYPQTLHWTPEPASIGAALGTAIATRVPVTSIDTPIPAPTETWRSQGVRAAGIDVFGFYFPLGSAKALYWNWMLANAEMLLTQDVLLIGDFNTGKHSVDEVGRTFDCVEKHAALESLGFVDTWRAANPEGKDYTWFSSARNGFRLDYIWASPSIASKVTRVTLDHDARLAAATDHSAVVADLDLSSEESPCPNLI